MSRLLHTLFLLVALAAAAPVCADGPVEFEAMLVRASNDRAPIDSRLERVEYRLRRMVKFESFRYEGGGKAVVTLPGEFEIDLGGGNTLRVKARRQDGRVRAEVQWIREGRAVVTSAVGMEAGAHAVFGGVAHEGGTLLVTLVWR